MGKPFIISDGYTQALSVKFSAINDSKSEIGIKVIRLADDNFNELGNFLLINQKTGLTD